MGLGYTAVSRRVGMVADRLVEDCKFCRRALGILDDGHGRPISQFYSLYGALNKYPYRDFCR